MEILITLGVLVLVIPACYLYSVSVVSSRFPALRNKRICLLIAHPDDEAMFFAPTVLALARPETGNHVKILCLSSGNATGLGETRKKELVKSGMTLGLRQEEDVFVVEDPDFPDSMTAKWDTNKIAALLSSAFVRRPDHPSSTSATATTATIDVLITFDARGVSAHPNHIALHHGARAFVSSLLLLGAAPGSPPPPVDLYTLSTVSVLRKYASLLDSLATLAGWALRTPMRNKARPAGLVFLSGFGDGGLATAWRAMTQAHRSQMVWFRYGWITLSRYMLINDLRLEKVSSQPKKKTAP